MADAEDVRRLALALPHVEEIDSDGFDFRVGDKGFVWSYPERTPGKPRRPYSAWTSFATWTISGMPIFVPVRLVRTDSKSLVGREE